MEHRRLTHKLNILEILLFSDTRLTATDFGYVSNANQYLAELENQGLITSVWSLKGTARVKLRYVANKQKIRASNYLEMQKAKMKKSANDKENSK